MKRGENIEVAVFVGFHIWRRNVVQAETCAMERYRGRLVSPLTTNILISYGLLRRGDATEFVDNIPYLLFGSPERTHDVQRRLDRRKLLAKLLKRTLATRGVYGQGEVVESPFQSNTPTHTHTHTD